MFEKCLKNAKKRCQKNDSDFPSFWSKTAECPKNVQKNVRKMSKNDSNFPPFWSKTAECPEYVQKNVRKMSKKCQKML
jgi:hypothetical protein